MSDTLKSLNIYFDEVDKVRIIDPEVSQKTNDLKDECKIYVESNLTATYPYVSNTLNYYCCRNRRVSKTCQ